MASTIRVGVIGAGANTRKFHIPNLQKIDGVEVHRYGPHIFHTQDADVWAFVNRFAKFNHYRHRGLVRQHNRLYSFPINLMTLHQVWGVSTPLEAQRRLAAVREAAFTIADFSKIEG